MNKRIAFFSLVCILLSSFIACGDDASNNSVVTETPIDLSSVPQAMPCKTDSTDTCEYGTLTDDRDGQTYKTVKIGDQWWMAENLNLETSNSFCWGNNPEKCEQYGRLYPWSAVMDSAAVWSANGVNCGYGHDCNPVYPVSGLCPAGWHVPTFNEWRTLFGAVGGTQNATYLYDTDNAGKKLRSSGNWHYFAGTDSYGFNVVPAGYKGDQGAYYNEGREACFWTSSEERWYHAFSVNLREFEDGVGTGLWSKVYGSSVRCVKD
ncbi:fibrobacter succinogenes major paralogous domain-containing protein [Fibrobacter sp. UWB12]|uniref:fibrobacter succinogenes major paralogous domain-containing protein n=1 Tax=Fibrobacter sp. UWB12 TaxID=1896203 RepID=UPI000913D68C|nr:fibrobacter succinogenes major paralogous domain-containing protein [Fibrobacter sp. UWB12]SHK36869.1 major paralogous domain-containing protein [Fibrobacter sp. UWB12]